jgi:hypothetical protein
VVEHGKRVTPSTASAHAFVSDLTTGTRAPVSAPS